MLSKFLSLAIILSSGHALASEKCTELFNSLTPADAKMLNTVPSLDSKCQVNKKDFETKEEHKKREGEACLQSEQNSIKKVSEIFPNNIIRSDIALLAKYSADEKKLNLGLKYMTPGKIRSTRGEEYITIKNGLKEDYGRYAVEYYGIALNKIDTKKLQIRGSDIISIKVPREDLIKYGKTNDEIKMAAAFLIKLEKPFSVSDRSSSTLYPKYGTPITTVEIEKYVTGTIKCVLIYDQKSRDILKTIE